MNISFAHLSTKNVFKMIQSIKKRKNNKFNFVELHLNLNIFPKFNEKYTLY